MHVRPMGGSAALHFRKAEGHHHFPTTKFCQSLLTYFVGSRCEDLEVSQSVL